METTENRQSIESGFKRRQKLTTILDSTSVTSNDFGIDETILHQTSNVAMDFINEISFISFRPNQIYGTIEKVF